MKRLHAVIVLDEETARSPDPMPDDLLPLIARNFDLVYDLPAIYCFVQTCRSALRALAEPLQAWYDQFMLYWQDSAQFNQGNWKSMVLGYFIQRSLPHPLQCRPFSYEYQWALLYAEHCAALESKHLYTAREKPTCTGILDDPGLLVMNAYVYDAATGLFSPLIKLPGIRVIGGGAQGLVEKYSKFLRSDKFRGSETERQLLLLGRSALSQRKTGHRVLMCNLMRKSLPTRCALSCDDLLDVVHDGVYLFDQAKSALRSTIYCYKGHEYDDTSDVSVEQRYLALRLYVSAADRARQLKQRLLATFRPPVVIVQ